MFQNNSELIKLAPEIYVYKNFLSHDELNELNLSLTNNLTDEWVNVDKYKQDSVIPAPDQVITKSDLAWDIYKKTIKFFAPEHSPLPSNGISKMVVGQSLEVHWDSPGHPDDTAISEEVVNDFLKRKEEGKVYDPLDTCHIVRYGYIVYLSDFEGGEVYYPELGIEYAPKPGDMLIHSSAQKYKHGVKPVTAGIRYTYSNFLTLSSDAPINALPKHHRDAIGL